MDEQIRTAAFEWLNMQTMIHGDEIPWKLLFNDFNFHGKRIVLIGAKGIWKPEIMQLPISISTSPKNPYNDNPFNPNGLLHYKYYGEDSNHPDNVGLKKMMLERIPLIYFYGLSKGIYLAAWPVYIIEDDPNSLTFTVALDDEKFLIGNSIDKVQDIQSDHIRREYITAQFAQRLHQRKFRYKVLQAYSNQCALCRLRHIELLDAAHIIGDREKDGHPIINNGIALCKIHHAAFDRFIIGISPDYQIQVRHDILEEIDGPMLRHGIQELQNEKIFVPHKKENRPDRHRLDIRFQQFLSAG